MTKALLTATDIKVFILQSICDVTGKEVLLSRNDLSRAIGLSTNTIDIHKEYGMPYILKWGKIRFPLKQVLKWLDANNKRYSTEKINEYLQKE